MKHYIGLTAELARVSFTSAAEPTSASHGRQYMAVIGPFACRADCDWARLHPYGYNHVSEVPGKRRAQQ